MHRKQFFIVTLLLVMVIALLAPELTRIPTARAATITVTTTADEYNVNPGACSLREAIRAANSDAAFGGCPAGTGADVIDLSPGATYLLTIPGALENGNATGDLDITDADGVTINGNGATIDAGALDRGLHHISGTTVVNNLIITNGAADFGGGLRAQAAGTVTLNTVTVSNSISTNNGGGIYSSIPITLNAGSAATGNTSPVDGGGIVVAGAGASLTLNSGSAAVNNTAGDSGGGIFASAPVIIDGSVVSTNTSATAGGGIYIANTTLTIRNGAAVITNTAATIGGGGVFANGTSTVTFDSSTINGNIATTGSGAGIRLNAGADFTAMGGSIVNNQNLGTNGGGFYGGTGSVVSITGTVISDNSTGTSGGGLFVTGAGSSLTMTGAQVVNNTATTSGGGVYVTGGAALQLTTALVQGNTTPGPGGGVFLGTSTGVIDGNSTLVQNTAGTNGGGYYGAAGSVVTFTGSQIISNTAASGGGMLATGAGTSVTLLNSQVLVNTASAAGGGIYVTTGASLQMTGVVVQSNVANGTVGGGILLGGTGNAVIDGGSVISQNTATTNGGGIDRQGGGALTITNSNIQANQANNSGGGLRVTAGTATITGSTIVNNSANNSGGGALVTTTGSLNVSTTNIAGNTTNVGSGAGIYATGIGTVTADTVLFQGNTAAAAGGALYANNLSATIIRSALIGNNAANTGGGIQASDPVAVTITNSTISGNSATNAGGGLSSDSTSAHTLNNVTIVNNSSALGGGISQAGAAPSVLNTIIGTNTAGTSPDCSGTFASQGYNLISNGAGCGGFTNGVNNDQVGVAPMLGPLEIVGSPTLYHMPQPGSPAINRGNNATCITPDQRGTARPLGGFCDIGSIEAPFVNTPPTWTATPPNQTVFVNATLTLPQSTFTDPDVFQTFTATIDWGDGSPLGNGTVNYTVATGSGTVDWPTHVYVATGVYTATVTISDGTDTDTATFTVTVVPPAVLSKAFAPTTILINEPSTLTFTITNPAGNPAANGLAFTDTLPAGLVLAADVTAAQCNGTVTGTAGTAVIGFSGGNVAAGPSTCTITATVTSATPGTYTNNATNVTGLSVNLTDVGLTATLTVNGPATLSKAFAPPVIMAGGTSTLTFTITNPAGNTALTGLAFTDTLPAGVTLAADVTAAQCGGTVTGTAGTAVIGFSGGTVAVGPSTCTITATVTSTIPGPHVNNETNITGPSTNLDPTGLTATLIVSDQAVLSKAFTPDTLLAGNSTSLIFTITNPAGATTQTGLAFTDTLPAGVTATVVGATTCPAGALAITPDGSTISLAGGEITGDPAVAVTCTFEVTVTSTTPGTYTNNETNISGLSPNLEATGLTATLTVVQSQATLSKAFAPATILAGGDSTLTFTIENPAGNPAQTGLSFTDELPLNVIAQTVAANTCGGTVNLSAIGGGATFVEYTNGTIGAGPATCTIDVIVTSDTPGVYTNDTTNLSNVSPNLDPTGLLAVLTVDAVDQPRLSKQFTPATIEAGRTASLTFTITNAAGNPAQTGLAFTDTLPAGVTVSGVPAAAQCGGNVSVDATVINFTGGALAAGEATCSITVTVTSSTPGTYTNDAANISNLNGMVTGAGITTTLTVTEGPVEPPVEGPSAEDHARAQAPLCSLIGGGTNPIVRADVQSGTVTDGSVFCRILAQSGTFVLNPAEVGIQAVVDLGVIHAVDVFGLRHDALSDAHFNYGVKVCLQGTGRLLYLDATQAPRPVNLLPSTEESGYMCGIVPNAGTVVLVP